MDAYLLYDMGFVFQDYALLEELTVEKNIALAYKEKASYHKEEIDELLKKVLLSEYQKRSVKNLSGGEKQRVALARALCKHPKVIFLDEPTSYADWILSLNEGKLISNLSYDESYQEKDSLYLSNLDEMSDEEISSLNEKMEKEGRRVIRSRKDLFRSTEEKKEPTGIPRKRSSYRFCFLTKTFFRILNRN